VLAESIGDLGAAWRGQPVEVNPTIRQLRALLAALQRANDWERDPRAAPVARSRTTQPRKRAKSCASVSCCATRSTIAPAAARLDRARHARFTTSTSRELADLLEPNARGSTLAGTAQSLRAAIAQSPRNAALYERLRRSTRRGRRRRALVSLVP
jgi:hypothetical protein